MRNSFDWTPYRRSTVGFDRLFDFLETGGSAAENYPPFDIEKLGDDHFRRGVDSAGVARLAARHPVRGSCGCATVAAAR